MVFRQIPFAAKFELESEVSLWSHLKHGISRRIPRNIIADFIEVDDLLTFLFEQQLIVLVKPPGDVELFLCALIKNDSDCVFTCGVSCSDSFAVRYNVAVNVKRASACRIS